jgi:hypothetical protein
MTSKVETTPSYAVERPERGQGLVVMEGQSRVIHRSGGGDQVGDPLMDRALVRTILEHADVQPWKVQDAGLLGLWLGPSRRYRLHVWDPASSTGEVLIHDHPLDFTSVVMAGEITNTRYEMDPAGDEFVRERYALGDEANRRTDSVRLSGHLDDLWAGGELLAGGARAPQQLAGPRHRHRAAVHRRRYATADDVLARRLSLGVGHLPPSGARRGRRITASALALLL